MGAGKIIKQVTGAGGQVPVKRKAVLFLFTGT
jgi:hypothetical protein